MWSLLLWWKTAYWPSHGIVPLSGSLWCYHLDARLLTDPLMAMSYSQGVCDLAISMPDGLLTLSWSCPVLRLYVILLFGCKISYWPSHGHILLLESMWSCYLDERLLVDPLAAMFCSQEVCDVADLMQGCLLTLSWLYPSQLVCDVSICMLDALLTLLWLCPAVRLYVIFLFWYKTARWPSYVWPCSALRKYVILWFWCKTACWSFCDHVPLSGSI